MCPVKDPQNKDNAVEYPAFTNNEKAWRPILAIMKVTMKFQVTKDHID